MPQFGRYIDDESFRRLMQRALIFPLILAICLAAIFLWQVRGLLQVNQWVDEGDRIISKGEHLHLSVTEMEAKVRGYVLFGTKDYQDFFLKAEVEVPQEFAELKEMVADNPAQLAILAEVETLVNRWIGSARESLALREKAGSLAKFKHTGKGRPVMAQIRLKLRKFLEAEIEVRNDRFNYARRTTRYTMIFGIFLALLLGLVLAIFSRRALMRLSLSYQGAFAGLEKKSQELALSEAKFRQLADAIPQIVWTAKAGESRVDYVNQRWFEYTGLSSISDWGSAVHPDDYSQAFSALKSAKAEDGIFEAEYRLRRNSDGAYRWHLGRAVPIFEDGALSYWFGTATDIEDQKQSQAQVERALSLRDEFISVASHELRTPLTSLKLQLQMAKREMDKAAANNGVPRNLSLSLAQVDRLTNLVDKLLDISRIQTGRLETELEDVDLSALVNELLDQFQGEFRKVGSNISARIEPGVVTRCDRFRIEQVFVNLLTNAMKYGMGRPIEISLSKADGSAVFSVRDQGLGIPAGDEEKIFERFQRAGASKNVDGIGLGLYIAREVVRAHQGDIYAESDGESGSTFVVELPI